jgi:hypothetical protein
MRPVPLTALPQERRCVEKTAGAARAQSARSSLAEKIKHDGGADFDSAVLRFESWRPSWSLPRNFQHSERCRHFRRSAAKSRVLARNIGHLVQKVEIFEASLRSMNFQYPKFWDWKVRDPVAFSRRPVRTPSFRPGNASRKARVSSRSGVRTRA